MSPTTKQPPVRAAFPFPATPSPTTAPPIATPSVEGSTLRAPTPKMTATPSTRAGLRAPPGRRAEWAGGGRGGAWLERSGSRAPTPGSATAQAVALPELQGSCAPACDSGPGDMTSAGRRHGCMHEACAGRPAQCRADGAGRAQRADRRAAAVVGCGQACGSGPG